MVKRKVGLVFAVVVFTAVLLGGSVISPAAEKKVYIVASELAWPPFEWKDEAGNAVGFDLDVMREIAEVEGYKIEIVDVAWDTIIAGVVAGKYDIGASGFTIKPKRAEQVDFSEPYYLSDQAVLIRKDSGLNIITALSEGRKVGAQTGTTGADWIKYNLVEQGVKVELQRYESYPLAVLDLINKNIDAVIQDEPASKAFVAQEETIEIAGIIVTGEEFGFLVQKGDPYGLLLKINRGMKKLKASGVWNRLTTKYFVEYFSK
ncbi:ABC transporter arginine-binding protein 1 [subsurface metagenome]